MAARTKKGLSVKTFKGLDQKRMASKGGGANAGIRVIMKEEEPTVPVQFLVAPDEFDEFEIHRWQEDGKWHIVPCLGDGCPLCDDESEARSKTTYRFAAPVYNLKEKKAQILEGPKDLAQKIFFKWQRKPALFLKRVWDVTRYPTNPVTYGCDLAEEDPIKTAKISVPSVDAYLTNSAKAYYGEELPSASSLDSDDDDVDAEDDDAESWDADELRKKKVAALKVIAKDEGVSAKDIKEAGNDKDALIALIVGEDDEDDDEDDDDEDDDDLDDDDDDDSDDDDEDDEDSDDDDDDEDDDDEDEEDDDEDEDDEPEPPKKSKKASAKKAPAKKAGKKRK